jgi:hypothetical protein
LSSAISLFLLVHRCFLGCRYFCWEYSEWNINIKHVPSHQNIVSETNIKHVPLHQNIVSET